MSDYDDAPKPQKQPQNCGPAATLRDGAVAIKVWENQASDGRTYQSATLDKVYTDTRTGETRSTNSFNATDLLKIRELAGDAYRTMNQLRSQQQEHDNGMREARDQAMQNGSPRNGSSVRRGPSQNNGPQY